MHKQFPPNARDRLLKLVSMLGSSYAGERANAGALATRLLMEHGRTWADLSDLFRCAGCTAQAKPDPATMEFADDRPELHAVREMAAECLRHRDILNNWEADFCRSMAKWNKLVSYKQSETIELIVTRVREACNAGVRA
jgi:hypothetical protein